MANFEVLSLDPTTPQIRAPGAGDGYSVPRNMTFASGTTLAAQAVTATTVSATGNITSGGILQALGTVQSSSGADLSLNANGANRDVFLKVNGTTLMTVQGSTTNVGIGTASPAAKLHVAGESIILDRSVGDPFINFYTGGSTTNVLLYAGSSTGFRVFTSGTERLRVDTSGNLGLGVTPSAWTAGGKNIEIGSAGNIIQGQATQIAVIQNATFNTGWKYSANGFASFYNQSSGQHIWYNAPSGTAGNAITFTQAMTLDASGNLGIGTTGANNKLQSAYTTSASVPAAGAGGHGLAVGASGFGIAAGALNFGAGYLQVTRWDGSAVNYNLSLQPNGGSVGIGTTSPTAKLDVSGTIQSTATGSAYAGYFNYVGATGQGVGISSNGAGSSYAMFFFNNGANVGNIYVTSTTTSYNTSSDRRLKSNIVPSPSASNVIDAIEIVSHEWKAAPDKRVTYGLIAQDLAKVAPEAVTTGDDGEEVKETWGVDYSKLVPILIKEVQALRKRVAELEAR